MMRSTKWLVCFGFAAVTALGIVAPARGAEVDDVVARIRQALLPGKDMQATFEIAIRNADPPEIHWTGTLYRRTGSDSVLRLVFESPADLKGTEVSIRRAEGGVDHTRMYLPMIRRVRDIQTQMRGESFLGTDFTFEDLGLDEFAKQRNVLRGDDTVGERVCRNLESTPEDATWIRRIVRCIDKENSLPLRTEYYDGSGILWRTRTLENIERVGEYPTALTKTMTTVPTGTSTVLTLSNVRYDIGLPDSVFAGVADRTPTHTNGTGRDGTPKATRSAR